MPAPNLTVYEVKAFVPARDFALSKRFYEALGFEIPWSSDDLADVRHGNTSFLLQNFYVQGHAENFLMHLRVQDVDDWREHVRAKRIAAEFGVRVGEPEDQPWGMRDFVLFDPSGVLWRVAQTIYRDFPPCQAELVFRRR